MTQLSHDQVRHIASLARLQLAEDEIDKFAKELTSILGYIDQLTTVDTSHVEATAQVTGTNTVLRQDELRDEPLADPDALLATSALQIVDHQIETPSAHG